MKRKFEEYNIIDENFLKDCEQNFKNDTKNILIKNVITNVGSFHASCNHEEAIKVSHVFLNSIKKKNLKATNQGASGRCWIFSGLNMFRHNLINALNLENFEFSETYLFFFDKFERSNTFLRFINEILYKETKIDNNDLFFKYLISEDSWISDGGYWSYFANLVDKYGLIPKSAMPETFQSEYSQDMNEIIINILHSSALELSLISKFETEKRKNIIDRILKQIYNTLVKFLGEPPKIFKWDFISDNGESNSISHMTSKTFKEMVIPNINLHDFILLSNIPSKKFSFYKKYIIKNSNNVYEGKCCQTINLPIEELKKYAQKSVLSGMPVWFAGDVGKGFNPLYSVLNSKINDEELLFGKRYKMNKEQRILFLNQKTSHAMTLVGINLSEKNKPTEWQVENSWGFLDNETLGLDGFLCMTDEWFNEYVGQVVIHKKFLSRNILKILDSNATEIEPWESLAPALKIKSL